MVSLLLAIIYISFVSLGLPDALLGSAWPQMHLDFGVPVSLAGVVAMTVSAGTIASSLLSDRLTKTLGAGKVTAISVGMTAVALLGFSTCTEYWMLLLWAIPYGLGAGSVDAALNNYVALHYASRHMSWLHCMWGVGASVGPYIMGMALTNQWGWPAGYRIIGVLQILLTAALIFSLPLWKKSEAAQEDTKAAPLTMKQIFAIPGAVEVCLAFFCYCAVEQTTILWASTYFADYIGLSEEVSAALGSLFLLGMTAGRAVTGFLTYKLNDENLIRLGTGLVLAGIAVMLLPLGTWADMAGFLIIGLGCAPIYPCTIHATPTHFGAENFQAVIGVQMASAYVGTLLMPPLFGLIANHIHVAWLPVYLAVITVLMLVVSERLNQKSR